MHEVNTLEFTEETAKDTLGHSPSFNWQRRAYMWLWNNNLIDRTTVWTMTETPKPGDTGLLASKILIFTNGMWINY